VKQTTDDEREARRAAYRDITIADRQARHDEIATTIADVLDARRAIGRRYLDAHPSGIDVTDDRAVAHLPLLEETEAARAEASRLNPGRTTGVDNGALQFPVLGKEFAPDGPVVALGTSPLVLAPVVAYLGMMPILFNLFVTRAHTTELLVDTAHRFHLDPEDVRSFKVFVHLTDVDDDCGPLHALPASLSTKVLDAVDYRGITFLDDARIDELVGWESVVKVTGPSGTVALADTTRCLHFGGRPRAAGKPVREMLVYQYLLPTSIFFHGERAVSARQFLPQLEPTRDDWWDALIGARFA
jgi:hypothetical protein